MVRMSSTDLDSIDDFNIAFSDFSTLTQKIMISTSEEMIDVKALTNILDEELERRNLSMDYDISYLRGADAGRVKHDTPNYPLFASAKSTYLMPREALNIHFENSTLQILKLGAVDLIVSFAIVTGSFKLV